MIAFRASDKQSRFAPAINNRVSYLTVKEHLNAAQAAAHAQPRRVAAMSVARRVADEMDVVLVESAAAPPPAQRRHKTAAAAVAAAAAAAPRGRASSFRVPAGP